MEELQSAHGVALQRMQVEHKVPLIWENQGVKNDGQ